MSALRVLSYNIRSLRDDRAAVVRIIRDARPDVVCIQEAPRFLRWRQRAADLARRCGLVVIGGGRPACGNLLLCQIGVRVERHADIRLSHRRGTHRRGAAVGICSLGDRRFVLVGTHLDLYSSDRLRHVHELFARLHETVGDDSLPVIIGADVNEEPKQQAFAVLASRLRDTFATAGLGDGFTSTARQPRRRIDAIFAERRLWVKSCAVIESDDVAIASDHRPVLAEIEL